MDAGWEAQQIILRVARSADLSDITEMVSYFSESAVVEVGERTVEGRDAIFEFFGGGSPGSGKTDRTKHVVTNTIVHVDGNVLVTTSYFQVLRSWGVANWGRYEDHLATTDGTLQIVRRKVFVDGQVPRPARPADTPASST